MSRKLICFFPIALYLLIAGCSPSPQYQDHVNIPKNSWDSKFCPEFHVDIEDTAAAYQLLFLIRHTDAYAFSNIWILLDTKAPGDTVFHPMRVEIPLAASSGQWLGRGMGELFEQHVAINSLERPAMFPKKGLYTIRLAQDMRTNQLADVMQVGLRIEKLGVARAPR